MLTEYVPSAAAAAAAAAGSAGLALLANVHMLCLLWVTAPAQPVFHEQHNTSVELVCMPAKRSDHHMQGG